MQIRVLGARQGESCRGHFASLLVDDILALDAGGLTAALTLAQQLAVQALLLTHHHYDHIKDLGTLGFNLLGRRQVPVYCTDEVRAVAEATVLDDRIWIDFFHRPTPEAPTFVHRPVQPGVEFAAAGYRVRPSLVPHSVPALAYEVTSPAGGTLLYTGDNGPGSGAAWASARPDVLVTEVTYPNADSARAAQHGHLTASLLADELRAFQAARGYLPRVRVVHVNPFFEGQVAAEVAGVAADLGADVRVAEEGEVVVV